MEKQHPEFWRNDTDEGGKNMFENEFLSAQIKRLKLSIKNIYEYSVTIKNKSNRFK